MAECYFGLLSKWSAVIQKTIEVTAQKTELFTTSVCVLHNFIIKEKRFGEEALSKCTPEAMTADHNNYTCNVAIGPTTSAPDVRHKFDNYTQLSIIWGQINRGFF
jgi:hypothetical protein